MIQYIATMHNRLQRKPSTVNGAGLSHTSHITLLLEVTSLCLVRVSCRENEQYERHACHVCAAPNTILDLQSGLLHLSCCRVAAGRKRVEALVAAGNLDEAAGQAQEWFATALEAGMQVPVPHGLCNLCKSCF